MFARTTSNKSPTRNRAYCRGCGYSLQGLTGGRCPECGKAFDLSDRRSFARRRPWTLRKWFRRMTVLLAFVALAAASVPVWYWWEWRSERNVLDKLRGLGAQIHVNRVDPDGMTKYLPQRLAFLRDHADDVRLYKWTTNEIEQIDFSPLTHVEVLELWSSQVGDKTLAQLHGFKNLRYLNLFDNPLDGSGLYYLGGCHHLLRLDLNRTQINDDALMHVGQLTSLESLDLESTNITDAGLMHLRGLKSLQSIRVNDTKVTRSGRQELQKLLPNLRFDE